MSLSPSMSNLTGSFRNQDSPGLSSQINYKINENLSKTVRPKKRVVHKKRRLKPVLKAKQVSALKPKVQLLHIKGKRPNNYKIKEEEAKK